MSINDELQLYKIKLNKMIEDINNIPHFDIPNEEFDELNKSLKSQLTPIPNTSKNSTKSPLSRRSKRKPTKRSRNFRLQQSTKTTNQEILREILSSNKEILSLLHHLLSLKPPSSLHTKIY